MKNFQISPMNKQAIAPNGLAIQTPFEKYHDDEYPIASKKQTEKQDTLMVVDKDKSSLLPQGISSIEELQRIYNNQRIEKKLLESKNYHQYSHEDEVTSILVSPDGRYVISGSKDNGIRVENIKRKKKEIAFETSRKEAIQRLAVSSDSKSIYVAAGTVEGSIEVFSLKMEKSKMAMSSLMDLEKAHEGKEFIRSKRS